jgi:LemA protein
MFGHQPKQNFTVQDEATISKPPPVDFGTPAQPAPEPKPEAPG